MSVDEMVYKTDKEFMDQKVRKEPGKCVTTRNSV